MSEAICPKCDREFRDRSKKLKRTRHHCYPRRHYSSPIGCPYIYICRKCHTDLEDAIRDFEQGAKLPKEDYFQIMLDFLGFKPPIYKWGLTC